MKKLLLLFIFTLLVLPAFGQINARQIAPGALDQYKTLLNNPAMVSAPGVSALGKNWFKLEMDVHVISDEVSVPQIAAVFMDLDNQIKYFDGQKSKISSKVVSRTANDATVDFISISIAPVLNIKIRTPYRALVSEPENSATVFIQEVTQLASDSASNNDIKDLYASRYAESISIDGKTYTYVRMYSIDRANASILPGAQGVLEKNSGPANIEAMNLLISSAKKQKMY